MSLRLLTFTLCLLMAAAAWLPSPAVAGERAVSAEITMWALLGSSAVLAAATAASPCPRGLIAHGAAPRSGGPHDGPSSRAGGVAISVPREYRPAPASPAGS